MTSVLRTNMCNGNTVPRNVGSDFSLTGSRMGLLMPLSDVYRHSTIKVSDQGNPSDDDLSILPSIKCSNALKMTYKYSPTKTIAFKCPMSYDNVPANSESISRTSVLSDGVMPKDNRSRKDVHVDETGSLVILSASNENWAERVARKATPEIGEMECSQTITESSFSFTTIKERKQKKHKKKTKHHKNKQHRSRTSMSAKNGSKCKLQMNNSVALEYHKRYSDRNETIVPLQTQPVKISSKVNNGQYTLESHTVHSQRKYRSPYAPEPGATPLDNKRTQIEIGASGLSGLKNNKLNTVDSGYKNSPRMDVAVGKKTAKIYYSERQSATMKDLGQEFPCAPPATPLPDVHVDIDYIPCMNDVRSQRAVKVRLKALIKSQKEAQEKLKEEKKKLDKIALTEKAEDIRKQQRLEIYALNKVMSELEAEQFAAFCKAHFTKPHQ